MLNLIQKFFKKDRSDKCHIRENFSTYFFAMEEHSWIKEMQVQGHFVRLFRLLPIGLIEALYTQYPLAFIPSNTLKYATAGHLQNTVVVFPEFIKLLKSSQGAAVAYLAHELALLVYELEAQGADPMMAEIEADKFVCDIGLSDELEQLLLMLDETIEKRLRLTYLTINHFSKAENQ
jgi:hypothetical protein